MSEYAELELYRTWDGEWEWERKVVDYSTWVCRDGTRVKVTQMEDSHLENTIRMLTRTGKAPLWLSHLLCEKMRRKVTRKKET